MKERYQGQDVRIQRNRSIFRWLGIDRRPDVVVTDAKTDALLEVGEAARTDRLGNFVPREQQKMYEYWERGIRYLFLKVK